MHKKNSDDLTPFLQSRFPLLRLHRWQQLCLGFVLGGLLCPAPGAAQTVTVKEQQQAKISELLGKKNVLIQGRPARKNDITSIGQLVETDASSLAGLLFGVSAGVRLGEDSSLTIGRCVQLIKGQAIVAEKKDYRLKGCVGRIEVNPRGTVYIMKLDGQNNAQVVVLEGTVDISSPQAPDLKVTVSAGQGVTATPDGTVSPVTSYSTSQLQSIAAPLVEGFQVPLPNLDQVAFLRPDFAATFLRDALLGREGDFEYWDGQKSGSLSREPYTLSIDSVVSGVFIRDTDNTGRFISSSPVAIIPIAINFDAQTISIGGIEGIASSAGLNGNNAAGTVFLRNGEVIRLEVFGVNKKEPAIGAELLGTLSTGTARDR